MPAFRDVKNYCLELPLEIFPIGESLAALDVVQSDVNIAYESGWPSAVDS